MRHRTFQMTLRPDRLKHLRERAALSQDELGNLIGVTMRTVGRYEQGTSTPDSEILTHIARILNISIDYLLGLTDTPRHYLGIVGDLTQEEGELITAARGSNPIVALDILYKKISKDVKPDTVIPRRKPKSN